MQFSFIVCFLYIPWIHFFSDYSEVATAGFVSVWSRLDFSQCIDIVLILFHILVLQEYWVLTESRIPLKLVLGDVRIVTLFIDSIKPSLLFSDSVGSLYF